jgi:hypothetical protein
VSVPARRAGSSPISCRKPDFPRETTSDSRSESLIPVQSSSDDPFRDAFFD